MFGPGDSLNKQKEKIERKGKTETKRIGTSAVMCETKETCMPIYHLFQKHFKITS